MPASAVTAIQNFSGVEVGCSKRAAVVALVAFLFLGAAGCAAGQPPPPAPAPTSSAIPARSPLGPRPAVLRLDGVDPCSLLTDAQRLQFDVGEGSSPGPPLNGPLQGPTCGWPSLTGRPDNRWTGATILNHGAEYAAGKEPGRAVARFPAVTIVPAGTDPRYSCQILLDVAPGQALAAAYENHAHDAPGMNHQVACGKAQQLVTAMLGTLMGQKHR